MDFHPFDSSEFSLQLYGTSQVKFTQLKDNPQWSNENLNKTFIGGKWTFFHDKAFNFTPSPAANVRQDLYPIQGTYSKSLDEIYGFQGECKSSVGTSASIDGIIRIDGE